MFDEAALQSVVAQHLEQVDLPAGQRGACVTVANADGVKAVIAIRVAEGWQVQAVVEHRWTDGAPIEYGVRVQGTW